MCRGVPAEGLKLRSLALGACESLLFVQLLFRGPMGDLQLTPRALSLT